MGKYKSKIDENTYVLVNIEKSEVISHLSGQEAAEKIKHILASNELGRLAVEPMQFKHLSFDEKREELLNLIKDYKTKFDEIDHGGRGMRDIFPLNRQQYEFVIELLKMKEN